jgi:hypothetical protein
VGDSVPFGYKHIRYSDQYVPRSLLEEIIGRHEPRSEVLARFGSPDAENADAGSIGYQRCITSDGYTLAVVVVPLPVPSSHPRITSCQRIGLWFDADDRAFAWKEARHKVTEDSAGTRFTLTEWIESPERAPVP